MSEYMDQTKSTGDIFYNDSDYDGDHDGTHYDEYTASYGCYKKHHRPCFTQNCCPYYRPDCFKYCKPVVCKCYPIYKENDRKYDCDRYDGGGFTFFGIRKRQCGCWGNK